MVLQVKELASAGEYQLRLRELAAAERERALAETAAADAAAAIARFDALQQACGVASSRGLPLPAMHLRRAGGAQRSAAALHALVQKPRLQTIRADSSCF